MSTASEFYLARAAECTRDAEHATLDNVAIAISARRKPGW